MAAIPPGEARLWFYRVYLPSETLNMTKVTMNGVYAGYAQLGGAFYRDVRPGHYVVTVETTGVDFNQVAHLDLAPGRESFVKIVSNPQWFSGGSRTEYERPTFYAWRIPNEIAQADVARLSFFGGS